jgi:hypothetical protein
MTIGTLRRLFPDLFHDEMRIDQCTLSELDVSSIIATELRLAQNAFNKAAGENTLTPLDRRDDILNLHTDYQAYGISAGLRQTFEMIRRMEGAAAKQAQQLGG